MEEVHFKKGAEVEVSSDDDGFRGAWFAATVVRSPSRRTNKLLVQYKSLVTDRSRSKPLIEAVRTGQVRPLPPSEPIPVFSSGEKVDAFLNDGWWEGIVDKVLDDSRYSVFFSVTNEYMEFNQSELRIHREWVSGSWILPSEQEKMSLSSIGEAKCYNGMVERNYKKGTLVEVSSDEDGFEGALFTAKVVEERGKDKFLIEYQSLRTDDDKDLLREEVDSLHMRPYPPEFVVETFNLFEEVDALYNDCWWVGVISKLVSGSRYKVYFIATDEEMVFWERELRLHQDWIDGKWVIASQALKFKNRK